MSDLTIQEQAQKLWDDISGEIGSSDFHVPKFISGIDCADGSKEYGEVYDEEENALTKHCCLIAIDLVIKSGQADIVSYYFDDIYWVKVKGIINEM